MRKFSKVPLLVGTASAAAMLFGAALVSAAPAAASAPPSPSRSQARLEAGMGTLGSLVADARSEEDLVRLNCVLDKRDRADEVRKLANTELMVIRDRNQAEEARTFAAEKLAAAADRLEGLVEAARMCQGDQAPEDEVDVTRTEADQKESIPVNDPASGSTQSDTLPPVLDPAWLPVASGSE